jgi:hypothetical protein
LSHLTSKKSSKYVRTRSLFFQWSHQEKIFKVENSSNIIFWEMDFIPGNDAKMLSHKLTLIEINSEISSVIRCNREGRPLSPHQCLFHFRPTLLQLKEFPWFKLRGLRDNVAQDGVESESRKNGFL